MSTDTLEDGFLAAIDTLHDYAQDLRVTYDRLKQQRSTIQTILAAKDTGNARLKFSQETANGLLEVSLFVCDVAGELQLALDRIDRELTQFMLERVPEIKAISGSFVQGGQDDAIYQGE